MNHSCSADLKIVYGDLQYSEIEVAEEACRTLGVPGRRNWTEQQRVQTLLAQVSKSGVEDQQEESNSLLDMDFPLDSESVFDAPAVFQLCCVKALGKLIWRSMQLEVRDYQLSAREKIRARKTLALAEASKRTPRFWESTSWRPELGRYRCRGTGVSYLMITVAIEKGSSVAAAGLQVSLALASLPAKSRRAWEDSQFSV